MFKNFNKPLISILIFAFLLRFVGLTHGFPFIFSVDEPALIRSSRGIFFNPNPGHFDWPHLHFYLNFFLYFLFNKFRILLQLWNLKEPTESFFPLLWRDPLSFYLISRALNAFLGALTVIPIYLAAKNLFGQKAALLSALAMTVLPFHVRNSHFALIDVPMTFWFSCALYFSTEILKKQSVRNYFFAGLFAGLSVSTKYNGAFSFLSIIMAQLSLINLKSFNLRRLLFVILPLVLSGSVLIFGFLLGTPYAAIDSATFARRDSPHGALWQFKNVGKEDLDGFFVNLAEALTTKFFYDWGVTFLILFEVFFIYMIVFRRTKQNLFIAIPALFCFLYVTTFRRNRTHYYMIMFPYLALIVGYMSFTVYDYLMTVNKKVLAVLSVFIVFVLPTSYSLIFVRNLSKPDSRIIAYEWISKNIDPSHRLFYKGGDLVEIVKASRLKTGRINGQAIKYLPDFVMFTDEEKKHFITDPTIKSSYKQVFMVDSVGREGPVIYIYEKLPQT